MKMLHRITLVSCAGLYFGAASVMAIPVVQSVPADLLEYVAPEFPTLLRMDRIFKKTALVRFHGVQTAVRWMQPCWKATITAWAKL
jgi:hypothetical protein